jgi:hypothetical protein
MVSGVWSGAAACPAVAANAALTAEAQSNANKLTSAWLFIIRLNSFQRIDLRLDVKIDDPRTAKSMAKLAETRKECPKRFEFVQKPSQTSGSVSNCALVAFLVPQPSP